MWNRQKSAEKSSQAWSGDCYWSFKTKKKFLYASLFIEKCCFKYEVKIQKSSKKSRILEFAPFYAFFSAIENFLKIRSPPTFLINISKKWYNEYCNMIRAIRKNTVTLLGPSGSHRYSIFPYCTHLITVSDNITDISEKSCIEINQKPKLDFSVWTCYIIFFIYI